MSVATSGHARARAGWFVAALAAAACAAPPGLLPLRPTLVALAIAWGLAPGALLARFLAHDWPTDARLALALLASPFAGGAGVTLLRTAGLGAPEAVRVLSALVAFLCAWQALRAHTRPALSSLPPGPTRLALGIGLALVVAHLLDPELSLRSDGSFHAGVVHAAARTLPPEDPFFAGLPLRYAWGIHAWAAAWLTTHPRVVATVPLACANAAAAVAALLGVAALARRLGASGRGALLAQGLALAGTAPFAWLVLAGRAASGDVRGAEELHQALDHGADAALRSLDPGWLHPSLVLPLDKFMVVTPFAWALAGAALVPFALSAAWAARSLRAAAPLALVVAAVVWLHPFGGLALSGAALAASLALAYAWPDARRQAAVGAALVAGAIVLLAPYLVAVATGGEGGAVAVRVAPSFRGLVSAALAGAWLLPPALVWLLGQRDPFRIALAAMLASLVAPAFLLRLPGDNQSKFLSLAFLLAAAPAAMAWAHLRRLRPLVAGALALSALPTLLALGWAYAHQSAGSADAPSRPPPVIVATVAELAPRDAVLVDATQDTTRGAAPALPGVAGRSLLWGGGFMARKWGHAGAALALRRAAAGACARGEWPAGAEGELLRSLGREVWLVLPVDSARTGDPRARVVARAGEVLLVSLGR